MNEPEVHAVIKPGISPYTGKPVCETYGAYHDYDKAKERKAQLEAQDHRGLEIVSLHIR